MYPTAIGSEPILAADSSMHWRRTMQGHAAANLMPVAAANRIGIERFFHARAMQTSHLNLHFMVRLLLRTIPGNCCFCIRDKEEIIKAGLILTHLLKTGFHGAVQGQET